MKCLLALLYVLFYCVFVTFPCGVLGQVWCLIVSIPDLCPLYFKILKTNLCLEHLNLFSLFLVRACPGGLLVFIKHFSLMPEKVSNILIKAVSLDKLSILVYTLGRRQSKMPILSMNIDQKLLQSF